MAAAGFSEGSKGVVSTTATAQQPKAVARGGLRGTGRTDFLVPSFAERWPLSHPECAGARRLSHLRPVPSK